MRLFCYSLLFLSLSFYSIAQKTTKTNNPDWITVNTVDFNKSVTEEGGIAYYLIDYQDNLINKEQYVHLILKVLNSEGIQEASDITATFDPSFQSIEFHKALIIRDGRTIEKLSESNIKTFQRETNLERSLYDGSNTAVINLSDIRTGDIIEFSYSIKGFNPINKGNYSSMLYQEYTLPVGKIYHKLVTDEKQPINYQLLNNAIAPKIENTRFGKEYSWKIDEPEYVRYDSNTPYWMNTQKKVSVSTFNNWLEVTDLLLPHYKILPENLKSPISRDKDIDSKEDIIIKTIRFVQDEIRYLGFEEGIGAYKPNGPKAVLDHRYGDCKDKSLLLSTLLQGEGITSFPMLVNTESNRNLETLAPSHNLFNHCIVYFEHEGKEYFVDPTISNQGGDLNHLYTPDYHNGLILRKNSKNLKKIPESQKSRLNIIEDIVIDSIGGKANFTVKTEYSGNKSDYMRSYFKSNTVENIGQEYLTFYSNLYPSISSLEPVNFKDDSRPWENILTTYESYSIDTPWETDENDGNLYFNTYSLVLESLINYQASPQRTMSYYAGLPYSFSQTTRVTLPEVWSINIDDIIIDNDLFSFSKKTKQIGRIITVNYNYELKSEVIPAELLKNFLAEHEKINNALGLQLTYTPFEGSSKYSWLSIIIALLSLILSGLLGYKLFKDYDPEPESNDLANPRSFGGWLILPAIGLVLTPFIVINQLFTAEYFNKGIWEGFELGGYENHQFLNIYLGFEIFYNISFLVFTIFAILLFFKKRTSAPKLMMVFYFMTMTLTIIESFVMNQVGIPDPTGSNDIFRSIISAAIWIPYFYKSKRVKETFVNTYGNKAKRVAELTPN
ncbi:DUF3857 domain-containing protein [Maribacter cobaltidurans]|uniref:Uncharacterized protein n=1 Tax=Maribacter cobaltidurans TaxID=1178778 RepID=A0A223V5Q3_9FLAO|nr:DUF2569 family protein [Maribacter cobaltidurans]ASV30527.1 hypothetical protein CJ263_10060 [Maribacter cobaltidurans]GGD79441.1 hypothetical protein GCM10011412_16610 [Maribacter cobaltidurans]